MYSKFLFLPNVLTHLTFVLIMLIYFHILNIDPDFSIVDSSEMGIMKDDAMEMLFEQMYEEN